MIKTTLKRNFIANIFFKLYIPQQRFFVFFINIEGVAGDGELVNWQNSLSPIDQIKSDTKGATSFSNLMKFFLIC
jgi:hypothetical protein